MCRTGGRRCPGGHSSNPEAQAARQRLCRARKALAKAEAGGEPTAIEQARERVEDAQQTVKALRVLAGANKPDKPNEYGLYRAERDAVSEYTGGSFQAINQYVQNGYQVPDYASDDKDYVRHMNQTVRALQRAVNRSPLDTPATAARAIHAETAQRVYGPVGSQVGQTITEDRFTSTTKGDTPLDEFGDVTIHYDLAAGTKALDVNASGVSCKQDENELLLGPHQPLRITSDQMVNGRRVLHMSNTTSTPEPTSAPTPNQQGSPMTQKDNHTDTSDDEPTTATPATDRDRTRTGPSSDGPTVTTFSGPTGTVTNVVSGNATVGVQAHTITGDVTFTKSGFSVTTNPSQQRDATLPHGDREPGVYRHSTPRSAHTRSDDDTDVGNVQIGRVRGGIWVNGKRLA